MVAPTDPKGINTAGAPTSVGQGIDSWGFVVGNIERRRVVLGVVLAVGGFVSVIVVAFLLVRVGGNNIHANQKAGFVRSAELSGAALTDAIHQNGLRSVLRLVGSEGRDAESYEEEKAVCDTLGVRHFTAKMAATRLPYRSELRAVFEALDTIAADAKLQPVLIHCRQGSDRTGLVSVIWLHDYRGVSLDEARNQLAFGPYMHVSLGGSGAMEDFLNRYETHTRANRANLNIRDWVKAHYFEEKPGRETQPWLDGVVYRP